MSAIILHAMDAVLDLTTDRAHRASRALDHDRAPGLPLLGFVIAMVLSAALWSLIGVTVWTLLT